MHWWRWSCSQTQGWDQAATPCWTRKSSRSLSIKMDWLRHSVVSRTSWHSWPITHTESTNSRLRINNKTFWTQSSWLQSWVNWTRSCQKQHMTNHKQKRTENSSNPLDSPSYKAIFTQRRSEDKAGVRHQMINLLKNIKSAQNCHSWLPSQWTGKPLISMTIWSTPPQFKTLRQFSTHYHVNLLLKRALCLETATKALAVMVGLKNKQRGP